MALAPSTLQCMPHGAGQVFVGEVPDPGRSVAEHDAALGLCEVAALEFAQHPCGERGRGAVGVAAGNALDGAIVRHRARVTAGRALCRTLNR